MASALADLDMWTAEGLVSTPRPHQLEAADRLIQQHHGAIFGDMGIGKGLIALLCDVAWGSTRTLVLCPKSVLSVWEREPDKHFPGRYRICVPRGSIADRVDEIRADLRLARTEGRPALVAVNYEAVVQSQMLELLKTMRWGTLILDESHRIKAPAGKTSRYTGQIATRCKHRLLLTGTPMPHSPMDIYAQFRAMKHGILGARATVFRARYAVMGGFGGKQITAWKNLDDMTERIDRWAVRIRKEDVLQHLPPWQDVTLPVQLPPKARRAYNDVLDDLEAQLAEGKVTAANAAVRCIRLQQVTNGVVTTDEGETLALHTEKKDALADWLEDLPAEEPVVVFGTFHADLDAIHEAAAKTDRPSLEVSGRAKKAHEQLRQWQEGDAPILAVQIQSGGVGIDLSRACYCVFYSRTWSLGDYEQARARVHRPGQARPVTYYHIVADDSMDQVIQEALDRKEAVVDAVIDALGGRTT